HLHAVVPVQTVRDAERVLAADRDERIDAETLERLDAPAGAAVDLERIGSGRSQDRSAPRQDPTAPFDVERHRPAFDDPLPAVEKTREGVAVDLLALAHHGSDHRVEPGTISTTGEHADVHLVLPPAGSLA